MSKLLNLFTQLPWNVSPDLTTTYTFILERSLLKYHVSINTWSLHQSKATFLSILYLHAIYIVSCFIVSIVVTLYLAIQFNVYLFIVFLPKQNKSFVLLTAESTVPRLEVINVTKSLAAKVGGCFYLQLLDPRISHCICVFEINFS